MAEVGTAFVTLAPSAKGFGKATEKQIAPDLNKSGKSVGSKFGAAIKVGAVAAVGAGAALTGFLKGAVGEARDAQKVGALTNAVIKSTGGVANVTAKDVDRLATSISLKTGVDDEAIAAGQNMLLTFGNVRNELGKGNDIFKQATIAATDMAAAFGGDAVSNSKMLGKALNDPTKGVSALTRVGVSFTEQQKEQIKTLQTSGDMLGAQKIILGELEKQTAGAAESQATAGEKAAVAWGNLQEQIGTALLPVIDRLMTVFSAQIIPAVSTFITQVQTGAGAGGQFAAAFGNVVSRLTAVLSFVSQNKAVIGAFVGTILAVVGALKVWAAVQGVLNAVLIANPIGLVVVAIAAFVAALVYAYQHSSRFRAVVQAAFAAVRVVVSAVIGWFAQYVPGVFAAVVGAVKTYIGVYKAVILGAFAVVRGAISGIGNAWDAAVNAVGNFVSGTKRHVSIAIGIVKGIPGAITGALGDLGGLLLNAGRELIDGLISGIGERLNDLRAKMGEIAGTIKGFLPGSPVKEGPLTSWNNGGAGKRLIDQGLIAGIDSRRKAAAAAMGRLASGATLPTSAPRFAAAGIAGGAGPGGGPAVINIFDVDGRLMGSMRGEIDADRSYGNTLRRQGVH